MSNPYGFTEVEPEYLEVMSDTVRLYQAVSVNEYGKRTVSSTYIEVPAHIEMEDETLLERDGETGHVAGELFLGWVVPWLSTSTRMDVPDLTTAGGWKTTVISGVIPRRGPFGIHHQEVFFGQRGASAKGYGP